MLDFFLWKIHKQKEHNDVMEEDGVVNTQKGRETNDLHTIDRYKQKGKREKQRDISSSTSFHKGMMCCWIK